MIAGGSSTLLKDLVILVFSVVLEQRKIQTRHGRSPPDLDEVTSQASFEFWSSQFHQLPCCTGYVDHDDNNNDAPRPENLMQLNLVLNGC